ncbi:MAG: TetR/AcrR family transcriptional regulator [Porphyrobacter sp.]|nr:TetR/AcrR family transcriptional regulator [Porphyrobacter sp.]
MADIARDAGVAVGTVYLRYRDKGELLAAVLEEAAGDFVAAMERPDIHVRPWAERLEPLFAALLTEAARHPDLPALMRLAMQLPQDPGHLKVRAAIERFMAGGQAAGAFRQIEVRPAAAIAHGMVQAAMREAMSGEIAPEDLASLLADAAGRWMMADRI